LSLNPLILSFTCSSLLECLSTLFIFDLRNFFPQNFCLILFSEDFHIFVKLLFHIFSCVLKYISLFFTASFVLFWSLLMSSMSSLNCFCTFYSFLFVLSIFFVLVLYFLFKLLYECLNEVILVLLFE
jgi:hypothetical protein